MRYGVLNVVAVSLCLAWSGIAQAQTVAASDQDPEVTQPVAENTPSDIPYGEPIKLESARRAIAAAEAEASRHQWKMNCAVVEPAGDLVVFEKMDGANYGSIEGAQDKARTAARWRRSTKVFFDSVEAGNTYVLALGPTPVEGGFPIIVDGKLIGAIGCGGGFGNQAATAAKAGRDAVTGQP
jgi:glc operon protein GlcG